MPKEKPVRERRIKAEEALFESPEKLLESQKMEVLGRLSIGIAHDFNNILTAIIGYTQLTLLTPKLDEGLRADIQEVLNAAFRAEALTRQLLEFGRRKIGAPKILDLNLALAELDRMLQRIIGETIKLTVIPASDLMWVSVGADIIGQVILNLVVNARDAMPKGGTITLRTTNVELGEEHIRARPDIQPGRYVRLAVEDSGEGMDAETIARIFEPFFSTKTQDKGTGLGLTTVHGIVRQSGGFIEVDSRPGVGSVFLVYLPGVEGELALIKNNTHVMQTSKNSETILVVDDDASVGLITRRMLVSQGFTVIEARGGEEALRLCSGPKKIDLVISDVVMPGISGQELVRILTAAKPECKVLFISGYAEGEFPAMTDHFISKPYTVTELLKKVRQALDSPPPGTASPHPSGREL